MQKNSRPVQFNMKNYKIGNVFCDYYGQVCVVDKFTNAGMECRCYFHDTYEPYQYTYGPNDDIPDILPDVHSGIFRNAVARENPPIAVAPGKPLPSQRVVCDKYEFLDI